MEKNYLYIYGLQFFFSLGGANLGIFKNDFAYMLRRKLVPQIENFPFFLKFFIRPMDYDVKPPKFHNWGDIYFYNNTTIIRIYGFLGRPFVLPRYVPLRIRFLDVMRQIAML